MSVVVFSHTIFLRHLLQNLFKQMQMERMNSEYVTSKLIESLKFENEEGKEETKITYLLFSYVKFILHVIYRVC